MVIRDRPNQRWRSDFVSDALTDERCFPMPARVDDVSRENVVLVADTSLSGHRVIRELHRIMAFRAAPKTLVSDNGTAFASIETQKWIQDRGIDRHHIARGKRQPNGFAKSFKGKPGNGSLHETLFGTQAGTHGIPTEKGDAQNDRLRSKI